VRWTERYKVSLDNSGVRFARGTWAALFALISFALAAGGYSYYHSEAGAIRREQSDAVTAVGELKAGQIAQWRKERLADAARAAGSPFVRRALEEWLRAPDTRGLREDWRARLKVEQTAGGYADALLVTVDGRILLAAKDDPDPVDPATRRAIDAALAGNGPVLSDFYRCPHGVVHVDSTALLANADGRRPLALLILRSDAEAYLYPLVQSWPTPSPSAETLLVRRDGDEVVFLNELRHRSGTALSLRQPLSRADLPAVQAVLGRRGRFEGEDYRGVPVLADLRGIPGSPWCVVAKVDSSEILAEAGYRAQTTAAMVTVLILFAGTLIASVYRRRQARLYREMFQAERGKREGDKLFRTTLYSIGDAVITTNQAGRVWHMNPVAEELTGWAEAEALNQAVGTVFHIVNEATGLEVEDPVQRVLREGQVVGLANHTLLVRRDGTNRPIADSGAPIRDEGGVVIGVVLVFRDQSAERLTEEALRQSEEHFRAIFDTASVGMAQADPQTGRWWRVNAKMCAITGYSADEMLTMRVSDITHPDDRQRDWEAFQRVVRGEATDYRLENRYSRKDGSLAWVNVNMTVLRGSDGRPVCTVAVVDDISERKRGEGALRASEERRRKLFDEATEGIGLADAETGEILDCNQAFLRLSGYGLSELIGKPQGMLHPTRGGDPPLFPTSAQRRSDEAAAVLQAGLLTRGGGIKQVEIKASVVDVGGRAVVQAFFRDITADLRYRKERETTLAVMRLLNDSNQTRELIRSLTRLIRDWTGCEAVGVRLREGNDFPYYETQGLSARFVAAESTLCRVDDGGRPLLDDQGYPVLECMCGNVLRGRFNPALPFFTTKGSFWTNGTTKLLATSSDADRLTRTRNRCNGEGYESVALFALRHGDQVLGLLQVNDRATDRFTPEKIAFLEGLADQIALALAQRQAQAKLRDSEQFNREVIAGVREGLVVYDRDFRYLVWNPFMEDLTGMPASEVLGKVATDVFPHVRENDVEILFRHALDGETVRSADIRFLVPRTGKSGWYSSVYSPHRDPHGDIVGVIGIIRDITGRKRAQAEREELEARLLQAQKMESVGRLAGGVAHDFNNMLSVILGHSELALRQLRPSDQLYQDIDEIRKAGQRSADLTRQLLAFARKQTIQPQILDLNGTIAGMLKMLGRLIGEDIEMVWMPCDNLWHVMMDPAQLDQILVNLTVNARDAISARGRIVIQTQMLEVGHDSLPRPGVAPGRYVLLTVSDNGCGMGPETLEHLFEPFFTTKPVGQGTGLGLATVYGIVEQNRGFILVKSEPGHGTSFEIYLPRHESNAPSLDEIDEAPAAPRGTETVLLVEDEQPLLRLTRRMLERLGYTVLTTENPRSALGLVEEYAGEIHLLLTDVVMPGLSGRELQARIGSCRPAMKSLFMSGYTADVIADQGVLIQGIHFLQKPFTLESLAAHVREALGSA
jgi:two-component system, cell cycle sensor histidine kinase and response regulator CckA